MEEGTKVSMIQLYPSYLGLFARNARGGILFQYRAADRTKGLTGGESTGEGSRDNGGSRGEGEGNAAKRGKEGLGKPEILELN